MDTSSWRRLTATVAAAAIAALAAGCSSEPTSPSGSASATHAAAHPQGRRLTLAVFTDSWGAGSHCQGCTPWAALLGPRYAKADGVRMKVLNFANPQGGNTDVLLQSLRTDPAYRRAVAAADVIVFNQGVNDFDQFDDQVFTPARQGTCGGPEGDACLAPLTEHWTQNLTAYAAVVHELRGHRPTAVRFVGVSNEYLSDAGLSVGLGGQVVAKKVFADFNEVSCAVAQQQGGACVDLRPVLNGKSLDHEADPDSARSMKAVADAVVARGLPELGVG